MRLTHKLIHFLAICNISSCVTFPGDKRPEGIVIERSKQSKPVWADLPVDQLVVNATEAKIHYYASKQRDLPIAVKLTQSSAIESSFGLWKPSFDVRLNEFPTVIAARTTRNEKEYLELIEQVTRKVHNQAAQIEDIYYERIKIEHPEKVPELDGVNEYFDVHVLVQLLPVDSTKVKTLLYQVFQTAKSLELRNSVKGFAPAAPLKVVPKKTK